MIIAIIALAVLVAYQKYQNSVLRDRYARLSFQHGMDEQAMQRHFKGYLRMRDVAETAYVELNVNKKELETYRGKRCPECESKFACGCGEPQKKSGAI